MAGLTFNDLRVDADLKFTDISTEQWRAYEFPEKEVRIERPIALNVSRSGGHRVLDAAGVSHYIPKGWIHLTWKADPHFVA
jgi:hypothetical protein